MEAITRVTCKLCDLFHDYASLTRQLRRAIGAAFVSKRCKRKAKVKTREERCRSPEYISNPAKML